MRKTDIYVPNNSRVYKKRNPFGRILSAILGIFSFAACGILISYNEPGLALLGIGGGILCLYDASITHRRLR